MTSFETKGKYDPESDWDAVINYELKKKFPDKYK